MLCYLSKIAQNVILQQSGKFHWSTNIQLTKSSNAYSTNPTGIAVSVGTYFMSTSTHHLRSTHLGISTIPDTSIGESLQKTNKQKKVSFISHHRLTWTETWSAYTEGVCSLPSWHLRIQTQKWGQAGCGPWGWASLIQSVFVGDSPVAVTGQLLRPTRQVDSVAGGRDRNGMLAYLRDTQCPREVARFELKLEWCNKTHE